MSKTTVNQQPKHGLQDPTGPEQSLALKVPVPTITTELSIETFEQTKEGKLKIGLRTKIKNGGKLETGPRTSMSIDSPVIGPNQDRKVGVATVLHPNGTGGLGVKSLTYLAIRNPADKNQIFIIHPGTEKGEIKIRLLDTNKKGNSGIMKTLTIKSEKRDVELQPVIDAIGKGAETAGYILQGLISILGVSNLGDAFGRQY